MLTLGSLFDGIGGWLLAAQHAGIKPLWRCEIDEYPRAVSEYHFPDADSYGDIRKIHGNEIAPVDIICAGSPCQNLSVAGNRKGLQGNESSLFYESIRILKEMRNVTNGKYPRFFVWENVTGAFSSNHGNDFRAVLSEIGATEIPMPQSGRWSTCGMVRVPLCDIAWRTLDAQYWGVPQRRRRIFLVADFNSSGGCAAEILFDPESVPGDIETSERAQQRAAFASTESPREASKDQLVYAAQSYSTFKPSNIASTLKAQGGFNGCGSENIVDTASVVTHIFDMTHASNPVQSYNGKKCHTLTSRMGTGGNQVPVLHYDIDAKNTIRKLTPTECERLQGLPDGYTDIEFKGKPASDARRYKAIGNGMAQPCADFVLKQIVKFQSVR